MPRQALLPMNNNLTELESPCSTEPVTPALSSVPQDPGFVQLDLQDGSIKSQQENVTPAISCHFKDASEITTRSDEGAPILEIRTSSLSDESPVEQSAPQLLPDQSLELDPGGRDDQTERLPDGVLAPSNVDVRKILDSYFGRRMLCCLACTGLMKRGVFISPVGEWCWPTCPSPPGRKKLQNLACKSFSRNDPQMDSCTARRDVRQTGFYRQELNKTVWEVPERFQNLTPVGSGAYGSVCSAYDVVLRQKVAVKKLSRPFQSLIHSRRSYRELRLLKHMKHENVIGLLDVFSPAATLEDFNELYLVTNLMGADLNNIVKFQRLSDEHVQFLIYQLLRGLKYIHSAGLIHRDLKPSNVAVNEDCELRILDFGLARQTDDEMTGYVATRWYRAPEIMLNWMHYNQNVDIWSVGCIMGELLKGKVLFPGTDYIDQLKRIMEVVGTPTPDLLQKICSEHAQKYIQSLPFMPQQDLEKIFRGANPLAVDLMKRMLVLDCDGRISASEALSHPYFSQYHDPDDEPEAPPYDQTLESKDRTLEEWKELVFEEVSSFKASGIQTDSLQVEQ
ncbi:unnamed protein product [Pleuronectes platessa]|uniref:mitogen-activated protein kinase n=1 Tax=Pleuronectes platessa TaxID=8262 RepID=A0A9N7TKQ3_PLEPL|nr:unnamed protein product [Pleuronectes platessa]